MKEINSAYLYGKLCDKRKRHPLSGQIELTYRCNLNCVHCYCKGSEDKHSELDTLKWQNILEEIQKQGCVYLCLTGGEPLIREDFLEIYSFAKKKGFLITIFTNGLCLREKLLNYLVKSPPYAIEITLNGITEATYESITQVKGSFRQVLENIKKIKEKKLPLILKSNFLKQNKDEISKIKAFVDKFLGKKEGKYFYKYDPMIFPRLNQDKAPINYRLSFDDIQKVRMQDADMWEEYQKCKETKTLILRKDKNLLYRCDSWMRQFFINPFGRLKFCHYSLKFSSDLRTTSFNEGFYKIFPKLIKEKFKTNSQCKNCRLRPFCRYCPARAFLETGNEESPVDYYCQSAEKTAKLIDEKSTLS